MKLRDMILRAKKIVDANPAALDYPVYVLDCRSGAMDTDASLHEAIVDKSDTQMSDLGCEDIGKPYICVSIG
jgi:hypothetical protein